MISFNQARKLYDERKNKRKRHVELKDDTKLLKLNKKNYLIKFKNNVIVKINNDDNYTLYNHGSSKELIRERINEFTPAKINKKWKVNKFIKFFNGIQLDKKKEVMLILPGPGRIRKKYSTYTHHSMNSEVISCNYCCEYNNHLSIQCRNCHRYFRRINNE